MGTWYFLYLVVSLFSQFAVGGIVDGGGGAGVGLVAVAVVVVVVAGLVVTLAWRCCYIVARCFRDSWERRSYCCLGCQPFALPKVLLWLLVVVLLGFGSYARGRSQRCTCVENTRNASLHTKVAFLIAPTHCLVGVSVGVCFRCLVASSKQFSSDSTFEGARNASFNSSFEWVNLCRC